MKAFAYLAGFLLVGGVGFGIGYTAGVARATVARLRALGFTRNSADLYRRCLKLLRRLSGLTDLDGVFAEDSLTDQTREEIAGILADHRKELNSK
jgi:hypothetical protein